MFFRPSLQLENSVNLFIMSNSQIEWNCYKESIDWPVALLCCSGLITPGGFSSVPAGMETPELIELRKKKIEEAMDGYVGSQTRCCYHRHLHFLQRWRTLSVTILTLKACWLLGSCRSRVPNQSNKIYFIIFKVLLKIGFVRIQIVLLELLLRTINACMGGVYLIWQIRLISLKRFEALLYRRESSSKCNFLHMNTIISTFLPNLLWIFHLRTRNKIKKKSGEKTHINIKSGFTLNVTYLLLCRINRHFWLGA